MNDLKSTIAKRVMEFVIKQKLFVPSKKMDLVRALAETGKLKLKIADIPDIALVGILSDELNVNITATEARYILEQDNWTTLMADRKAAGYLIKFNTTERRYEWTNVASRRSDGSSQWNHRIQPLYRSQTGRRALFLMAMVTLLVAAGSASILFAGVLGTGLNYYILHHAFSPQLEATLIVDATMLIAVSGGYGFMGLSASNQVASYHAGIRLVERTL